MKFAYLVKPKIPIRCLPAYGAIMRSKIVDLEKDEVLGCLRCGQVFRRFTDGEMVQVTRDNIDKVHVTRLQYKGLVEPRITVDPINDLAFVSNPNTPEKVPTPAPKVVAFGQPIEKTEEEKKPEEVNPEEAAPVEEKKEEVPVEEVKEEKVEETTVPEENKVEEAVVSTPVDVAEETEKVSEDDKVEDTAEDKVEEEKPAQNQNNNNQQNFKKNNKKH